MEKHLTKNALSKLASVSVEDKRRIEDVIENLLGSEDSFRALWLRGYLTSLLIAVDVTDTVRAELGSDGASFLDGWKAHKEYCGSET